jgi:hypothetical protein
MPKKRGSHFKKKRPPTDPVLAYFEQWSRKQIIGMLLIADAATGVRNVVLQELEEHLTDEQKERLSQIPYQELVSPSETKVTPLVEVQSGSFTAPDET